MLFHVVAFLSHLSVCVPAARQDLGEEGQRHLQAGMDTGEEGGWCMKGCPDWILVVGIPGRQFLWLTAQNSDSAGFQETLAIGLLCDFRQIF